jgi:predicted acylesterase/phospholipase RssA
VRILAIDGGGIRGLIPAVVLADLEARTGRRVADLFDLIAGTSTGGILACALNRPADTGGGPAFTAADLVGLYESEGPEIFHRSLLVPVGEGEARAGDERYDDAGLVAALRRFLGAATLSQTLTDVYVTAYEIEHRRTFAFRSSRARDDPAHDFTLVDVARATAAAPTYFAPARVRDVAGEATWALVDGGLYASNPALAAVADAHAAGRGEVELVVSLGTGRPTRRFALEEAADWGRADWARPILDMVSDGVAGTVDEQLSRLLPDGHYVRLQTRLDDAGDDLDDAGDRNMEALRRIGARLVEERAGDLDRIAAVLTS